MVKRRAASASPCFAVDLQLGVLSQRTSGFAVPWHVGKRLFYMGNMYCVLTVPPFAPPTHDWFHQSRAGKSFFLKSPTLHLRWLNYGESKVLAAACYVYTCLYTETQHLYMTLKSTHCGVAGNRFHICMTSATKDENEYRAREYTPALSRQRNET